MQECEGARARSVGWSISDPRLTRFYARNSDATRTLKQTDRDTGLWYILSRRPPLCEPARGINAST